MTTSCITPPTERQVQRLEWAVTDARASETGLARGLLDFLEHDGGTTISPEGRDRWRAAVDATDAAERALVEAKARIR